MVIINTRLITKAIGKIEKNGEGYVVNFFILKNNLNFKPE